jgi:hypothetical protein
MTALLPCARQLAASAAQPKCCLCVQAAVQTCAVDRFVLTVDVLIQCRLDEETGSMMANLLLDLGTGSVTNTLYPVHLQPNAGWMRRQAA